MKIKKQIVIPIVIVLVLGIAAGIAVPRILQAVNRQAPQLEAPVSVSAEGAGLCDPQNERRSHAHVF